MSAGLLIDNWTLQDIGACLHSGLGGDTASELIVDRVAGVHSVRDVPMAGVQVEAIVHLLNAIVLRDSILIDSEFTGTWAEYGDVFERITSSLVQEVPFLDQEERIAPARKLAVESLCTTRTLSEIQLRNEQSWAERRQIEDRYMSAVLWGTAGMLARSHLFEVPYCGHPLRQRVIAQAYMGQQHQDVVAKTTEWIATERMRLFEIRSGDKLSRQALLVLPPIAIEVIEECNSAGDLIRTAFDLRSRYAKLRQWLKDVQLAVESEDAKGIAKYKKVLDSVAKDVNRATKYEEWGKTSIRFGFGLPDISISIPSIDGVLRPFGMRTMLGSLIFSRRGEHALKRLLRLLGGSDFTSAVQRHLSCVRL